MTLSESRPLSGHAWGVGGIRTEGLAQTSGDPLPAPRVPTLPVRLHLNCAAYTRLPSAAPRQPPSRFLPRWTGSARHACCSCSALCWDCPPKPSPTWPSWALLPSTFATRNHRSLPRPVALLRRRRAGAAHAPGTPLTRDHRNVPPPPLSTAPSPAALFSAKIISSQSPPPASGRLP